MKSTLRQRRADIDEIDAQLLDLLNQRARIAADIGRLKRTHDIPVLDCDRESQIFRRLRETNKGPLDARGVATIFRCILRESRRIQSEESGS